MAPPEVELRVRRLRWAQAWASDPGNRSQALAAVLGQLKQEAGPTYGDGAGLRESANPWAKKLVEDLGSLAPLEEEEWLAAAAGPDFSNILSDSALAAVFVRIDVFVFSDSNMDETEWERGGAAGRN